MNATPNPSVAISLMPNFNVKVGQFQILSSLIGNLQIKSSEASAIFINRDRGGLS